ncbi:MAG: DUF2752 domain-containing protein [Ruminiclostridium sp.]|nr:DUF2752 domain-containing protein [Ruminiclostridium sp.]
MKKYLKLLIPLSLIALIYLVFHIVGIGCPIKFITGVSCPGCGMSRACLWLLAGDIGNAFYFHPLFWAVPLFPVLYILRETGKMPKKVYEICIIIICILFLLVWIVRIFSGSDVVVFAPDQSAFARAIRITKELMG